MILLHYFLPKVNFKLLSTTTVIPTLLSRILTLIPASNGNFLTEKYLFAVLTDLLLGLEQPDTRVEKVVDFLLEMCLTGGSLLKREAGKALTKTLEKHEGVRRYTGEGILKLI